MKSDNQPRVPTSADILAAFHNLDHETFETLKEGLEMVEAEGVGWEVVDRQRLPAVGTRVRTRVPFSGVPEGSEGVVDGHYGTGVMVAWDLPTRPLPPGYREYDGRPAAAPGAPLRDGFDRREIHLLDLLDRLPAQSTLSSDLKAIHKELLEQLGRASVDEIIAHNRGELTGQALVLHLDRLAADPEAAELTLKLRRYAGAGEERVEPEELLDYVYGRLPSENRAEVEAKIAADPEAQQALQDIRDFPDVEPAEGVEEMSAETIETNWQRFREQLR